MQDISLTVFTPTFNRAYKLKDLYHSLKRQSNKNFDWLIIDDGSNDSTEDLVREFKKDNFVEITYVKKENEGKHVAINIASEIAVGDWIFIVDSDDTIVEDAIDKVLIQIRAVDKNPEYAGVAGLRSDRSGNVWNSGDINKNNNSFQYKEKNYVDATPLGYRYKIGSNGDRAEVIKREILQKYKFPVFKGENFLAEGYLWFSLGRDNYKFRWFNDVIYICEYLEDGLTRNGRERNKRSWRGSCFYENFLLTIDVPFTVKLKSIINYYRYGLYGKQNIFKLYKECKLKSLSLLGILGALVLRVR